MKQSAGNYETKWQKSEEGLNFAQCRMDETLHLLHRRRQLSAHPGRENCFTAKAAAGLEDSYKCMEQKERWRGRL